MINSSAGPVQARPAKDAPSPPMNMTYTAERRVRALAPTVFCPSTDVDQCVQRATERKAQ
jgi:hypothetical protein